MWADKPLARRHWADANSIDDATLDELLEVAFQGCVEYAPVLAEGAEAPLSYQLANVFQAREVRAAALRDGDVLGVGDYTIRARPLTGAVKQLLRPQRLRRAVG